MSIRNFIIVIQANESKVKVTVGYDATVFSIQYFSNGVWVTKFNAKVTNIIALRVKTPKSRAGCPRGNSSFKVLMYFPFENCLT